LNILCILTNWNWTETKFEGGNVLACLLRTDNQQLLGKLNVGVKDWNSFRIMGKNLVFQILGRKKKNCEAINVYQLEK
jgi:hypothetical protein